MYCKQCGNEINETFNHCPFCGCKLKEETTKEENLTLWSVLSFFIPIAGLIFFILWNDDKPKTAKACGKGALIGLIVTTILSIIIAIIFLIFTYGILQQYPY